MKRGRIARKGNSRFYFEKSSENWLKSNRSQVTIFVVIAIVIIAGIGGYFLFKNIGKNIPTTFTPAYDYYISCVGSIASSGDKILGSQAGFMENDNFAAGSEYAPFSNELNFMGMGIKYWSYMSANGIWKEQIPTIVSMQNDLNDYIKSRINDCSFDSFNQQGIIVDVGEVKSVKTTIENDKILITLGQKITFTKGEATYVLSSHTTEVDSRLGKFYDFARKVYDYEKNSLFLENYSIDVLYSYAPVEGVKLNCSPVFWNAYDVLNKLKKALEANIGMIKVNGNYYNSKNKYTNYFVVGEESGLKADTQAVRFLYSSSWPSRFEVWPTKGNIMSAEIIGNQQGLNMLGFCYAPYKFVYDMFFPVLIQIYDNNAEEVFEFPVAIVINRNVAKEAAASQEYFGVEGICDNANSDLTISTYNINLQPIEADIEFKCLGSSCGLGKTKYDNSSGIASIDVKVAQCGNAVLVAKAEGYDEKSYAISTNKETRADIVLEKNYNLDVEVYVDNSLVNDLSVIVVNRRTDSGNVPVRAISYPYTKKLLLGEGDYEFNVKIYRSGSINIHATTKNQCVTVSQTGILGLLGFEQEKCYDINVPGQTLTNLIYGGGVQNYYAVESELKNGKTIKIYAKSVKLPSTLEEVGSSYDASEKNGLDIEIV